VTKPSIQNKTEILVGRSKVDGIKTGVSPHASILATQRRTPDEAA